MKNSHIFHAPQISDKNTVFPGLKLQFYPWPIPVNYTISFKKAILSKVKNRLNQDYYSKTYNQNYFILCFIFQKI